MMIRQTLRTKMLSPRRGIVGRRFWPVFLFLILAVDFAASCPAGAWQGPPVAPSASSSLAAQHFAEAQNFMQQGSFEAALAAAQEGLKTAPENVPGLVLLGAIYARKGDFAHAEAAFRRALQTDPQSAPAHNGLGNLYFAEKKVDWAENEFRATLRDNPRDAGANYNLGLVLLAQRDARQAIVYLRRVQPARPEVRFNLAQACFLASQKREAMDLVKALSAEAKDDVRMHFSLGVLLAGQREYSDAIREFETADALKPDTFEILFNLGQAHKDAGDQEKALVALGRARKLSPDSVETLYLIAQIDADEGKDLDSLELLVQAHKLAPRDTNVIFLMARGSMKQSFYEDAIPLLEEGLKVTPHQGRLLAALGECYFMVGKADEAKDTFQKLIQDAPTARSYAFMALCYRHQGRYEEAVRYLKQGLKADPHDVACLYNMGYIMSRQGQYEQAEKWLQQALAFAPDYFEALREMADVKMHQEKYPEAILLLRKCTPLDPQPGPDYYRLQIAERKIHETEAAERDLRIFQTLSRDPDSLPAAYQDIFAYLDHRVDLSPRQRTQMDVEQLEQEVKLHPDRPRNLYVLAESYLKLGSTRDAKQVINQLDDLSQGDFRTALGVGVLLSRYHQYPDAIAHFQQALQSNPMSDDGWYDLADVYYQNRNYADALAAAQHVSPQGQKEVSYLALLADIDVHRGQQEEAIRLLRQEIATSPDQDQAYLSLAMASLISDDASGASQALQQGLKRIPDSGQLRWGVGILSAMEGNFAKAERDLQESIDLMPAWAGSYSALGVLYYQTGQIDKARETLNRFKQSGARGALDVQKLDQLFSRASGDGSSREGPHGMTPEGRQQFLQIALAFADRAP